MKTDLFCHEADVCRVLQQFDEAPIHKTFAAAIAHLVIQAAQKFLANLQTIESMKSYFHHTSTNVVLFETTAYLWSMLSFDINETIRYEFEEDKNAVQSGMLDGFNNATAIIKNHWLGFTPETYSLSRVFLYPKDTAKAAENFYRILEASEGRDFPLFPGELGHEKSEMNSPELDGTLSLHAERLYKEKKHELGKAVASLVSHFHKNRLD